MVYKGNLDLHFVDTRRVALEAFLRDVMQNHADIALSSAFGIALISNPPTAVDILTSTLPLSGLYQPRYDQNAHRHAHVQKAPAREV